MEMTQDYDAVVIGSGIAGMAAAATLAEAGHSVAVLEKCDRTGGSTAMSGGWFAFSGTDEQARAGIDDTGQAFIDDMRHTGEHKTDDSLLEAYVDLQRGSYDWMKDLGAEFTTLKISSGQSAARSHLTDIHQLMETLQRRVSARPECEILTGQRVVALRTDQTGAVTAVEVTGAGGTKTFRALAGVVLATGGFSRGTDLLEIFAPNQLAGIPYGGKGSTGDGLKMAWKLGAGFRDMGYIAGTYGSHPETGDEEHELLTAFYMGAVIVNKNGQRFADESRSYKTLGLECLKQPDGLGIQIFDTAIRKKSQPGVPLSDIDHLEKKGRIHRADSLGKLAMLTGIDPKALEDTVHRYNRAVDGDSEDDFNRSALCNGVGDLIPIQTAPFYAYPAKTLMTSTYCGLTVTPRAEVTAIDGSIIDGLYACGEVVGGFHGTAYMTGTALSKGLIFGKAAAEQIIGRLKERPAQARQH